MRSIVPRDEKPAASARLAHSITSLARVPGIVVGSPIPIFMRSLLSYAPGSDARGAPRLGPRAGGRGAGGPARAARRAGSAPRPPGDVRGLGGGGVERDRPEAQARGGAGAGAPAPPPSRGRAAGGPLRRGLVEAGVGRAA